MSYNKNSIFRGKTMQSYTSRGEAKLRQQSQYFTGLPCKNGHVTYRYTSSGACSGCIRQHNKPLSGATEIARKNAKAQLVQIRLRCHHVDREALAAAMWSFALMRYPELTLRDIDPHLLPKDADGNAGLFAFYCHLDDVAAARGLADKLLKTHHINIEDAQQKAKEIALGYLGPDTTPPMSFK